MLPTFKIMKKLLKYFLLFDKWILIPIAAICLMTQAIFSFFYYCLEDAIKWLERKIDNYE